MSKTNKVLVTKKDIWLMLEKFDIKHNDTVMVHSSMRSTGGVDGGCDTVIDAFKEYLYDGLFLVPSHTWDRVNSENPLFDVKNTMPCTGALTVVATKRSDGVRSLHPTHSVVAFGKRAEEFVAGEENANSPCPPGGCWARLYDEKAKIILLGVTHTRNTFIHAIDEMIDYPGRLSENPFEITIVDHNRNMLTTLFRAHKAPISEFYQNFKKPLEELGAVSYGALGNATVYSCDAVKLTHVLKHIIKKAGRDLCTKDEEIPYELYKDLFYK